MCGLEALCVIVLRIKAKKCVPMETGQLVLVQLSEAVSGIWEFDPCPSHIHMGNTPPSPPPCLPADGEELGLEVRSKIISLL